MKCSVIYDKSTVKTSYDELQAARIKLEVFEKYAQGAGRKKESQLPPWKIDCLKTSLAPINLRSIRLLGKVDLVTIILVRETFYHQTISEFQDSLKHNDRIVFKNQQKEIQRLTDLLVDNSPLFKEVLSLREENKKLLERNKCLRLLRHDEVNGKLR